MYIRCNKALFLAWTLYYVNNRRKTGQCLKCQTLMRQKEQFQQNEQTALSALKPRNIPIQ